jgi:hypothetical protein
MARLGVEYEYKETEIVIEITGMGYRIIDQGTGMSVMKYCMRIF